MTVIIKELGREKLCYRAGSKCVHNNTEVCLGCNVLSGNTLLPELFEGDRI